MLTYDTQNVASDLKPDKKLTSRSGTLAYLAPEVYEEKGYGSEVDWWSLGVTFFECIYNKVRWPLIFRVPYHRAICYRTMHALI